MKILHTSDWHLGRSLYGRKRDDEFAAFLDWLTDTIRQRRIDALLIAGDIFDTGTPGNRAQELYYRFLAGLPATGCRHVVIIAGNHDSPSFLNAPRALLKALDVHVVGAATTLEEQVIVLRDQRIPLNPRAPGHAEGTPELIVCAVPYLRDRDLRTAEAGESIDDKERKLLEGIRAHYAAVGEHAQRLRQGLMTASREPTAGHEGDGPQTGQAGQASMQGGEIPIVGMGHLFTAGGQTVDGDGVRDLYVGSLAHVTAGVFPECCDYVALGHLHVPQKVGGRETIRYSGSPLPMGFGEARQQKVVCEVTFTGAGAPAVTLVDVPVFRKLERLKGNLAALEDRLRSLAQAGTEAWLEVVYDGDDIVGDLRERLEAAVAGTGLEMVRIRNNRVVERALAPQHGAESLDDLDEYQVFARCLAAHEVPEEQRPLLTHTYREVVASLHEHPEDAGSAGGGPAADTGAVPQGRMPPVAGASPPDLFRNGGGA